MHSHNIKQKVSVSVNTPLLYKEALAQALVLYAYQNDEFTKELKSMVTQPTHDKEKYIFDARATLLYPMTREYALKRATLLTSEENKRVQEILSSVYEAPKNVVFGIVGLAVIGPTLGLIKKRRIKNEMPLIVSRVSKEDKLLLAGTSIARTALTLFESELEKADNKMERLQPETHDWFYGSKDIALYTTHDTTLENIADELTRLDIPHVLSENEHGTRMLAVSPSVNTESLESTWDLVDCK